MIIIILATTLTISCDIPQEEQKEDFCEELGRIIDFEVYNQGLEQYRAKIVLHNNEKYLINYVPNNLTTVDTSLYYCHNRLVYKYQVKESTYKK